MTRRAAGRRDAAKPANTTDTDAAAIRARLKSLLAIVEAHGGRTIAPGLRAAIDHLEAADRPGAASIFATLLRKKGLLGDFYVTPARSAEAGLLNREVSGLLDDLWGLFEPA